MEDLHIGTHSCTCLRKKGKLHGAVKLLKEVRYDSNKDYNQESL